MKLGNPNSENHEVCFEFLYLGHTLTHMPGCLRTVLGPAETSPPEAHDALMEQSEQDVWEVTGETK